MVREAVGYDLLLEKIKKIQEYAFYKIHLDKLKANDIIKKRDRISQCVDGNSTLPEIAQRDGKV